MGVKRYLSRLAIAIALILALYMFLTDYIKNPDVARLPYYALNTLARLSVAYVISLTFGLVVGISLGMNERFSRVFLPVFDVLQSIPILGYFPAAVVFLIALFHGSQFGVEVAAQLLLFTSMVWNILFAVYSSVRTIPSDVIDAAREFGVGGFKYIRHIVIPYTIPSLVTSSSLAWGGGWFFIIAAEFITYASKTYVLPGLGSLIARAAFVDGNLSIAFATLVFMSAIVLITNQFIWRKLERKSGDYRPIFRFNLKSPFVPHERAARVQRQTEQTLTSALYRLRIGFFIKLAALAALLAVISSLIIFPEKMAIIKSLLPLGDVANIPLYTLFTLGRIFVAYVLSLAVGSVLGILAAESERLNNVLNPIYMVGQSVPVLAVFPIIVIYMLSVFPQSISLEITSVISLFLVMVWYIFINVMGSVKNIPKSINDLSRLYKIKGVSRLRNIIIPAIIPGIVTGSMLSIAGGWNVIIFSESITVEGKNYIMPGLGYLIDKAAYQEGNTLFLLLLLGVIASIVIIIETLVWKKLLEKTCKYKLGED